MPKREHADLFLKLQKEQTPCWWSRFKRRFQSNRFDIRTPTERPTNPIHDLIH